MLYRVTGFLLLTICLAVSQPVNAGTYGDPMPASGAVVTLTDAIANPAEKQQKISGTITEVCQKKGCFMVLTNNQQHARITFKDYGFVVPKDSAGREALVYGVLNAVTLSAERANHYEADAGREGTYTDSVTEYSIVASSVVIN